MAYVVPLSNFRPAPRYDGVKWATAVIEQAAAPDGASTDLETKAVPSYADAAAPPEVSYTTSLATLPPDVGWFRLRFLDATGGVSYSDWIGPSGYPTTEELVGESSVTELTEATEDDQDLWRDEAIGAVEYFTGQSFEAWTGTLTVDGRAGDVIYLPRRLDSMSGFAVAGASWPLESVALGDDHDRIFRLAAYAPNYYVQAIRSISGYVERGFETGRASVAITGTWGWVTVPRAVRRAIRLDMEDAALAEANGLAGTVRAYRKLGLKGISQGNLRADVGDAPALSPRVARLLGPYAWQGIGRTA
jgi:hypothetical protein